jgi:hypothetical protein
MSKHLADHRTSSEGGRSKHFLNIEKNAAKSPWEALRQQPRMRGEQTPRVTQYLRIERGELA